MMIKKLLKGAVRDALNAKDFDTADRASQAFEVVADLDHALNKEIAFSTPHTTEQERMCKCAPWEQECRMYDI
jgi:hypothetical protein